MLESFKVEDEDKQRKEKDQQMMMCLYGRFAFTSSLCVHLKMKQKKAPGRHELSLLKSLRRREILQNNHPLGKLCHLASGISFGRLHKRLAQIYFHF
jgi:hypothetical protein